MREMVGYLATVSRPVCEGPGAGLAGRDGEDDHVRLLVEHPPKVPVASLAGSLEDVPITGERRGRRLGHQRFRSRKDNRQSSARLTRNGFALHGDRLYVAEVGDIEVRWSRALPSEPSSVTVIREAEPAEMPRERHGRNPPVFRPGRMSNLRSDEVPRLPASSPGSKLLVCVNGLADGMREGLLADKPPGIVRSGYLRRPSPGTCQELGGRLARWVAARWVAARWVAARWVAARVPWARIFVVTGAGP
jgi:REP element-mobilizing transposase RayT